jgi:hypothetical protein
MKKMLESGIAAALDSHNIVRAVSERTEFIPERVIYERFAHGTRPGLDARET